MPQSANKKIIVYVLIALGFAGLIGAHELAGTAQSSADDPWAAALPLILAASGTLCFVAAGLLARKLMKQGASK
jgi:hypothetical protein